VSNITKACGISRQTFYHHFRDKYSVIEYLYEPAIKEIGMGCGSDIQEVLLRMYEECCNNRANYISVISYEGQNSFEEYCIKGNREFFMEYFTQKYGNGNLDKSLETAIDSSCHGAAFTLISWIRNGMKECSEFIA
jgi:AcrR family transcriptional regulator